MKNKFTAENLHQNVKDKLRNFRKKAYKIIHEFAHDNKDNALKESEIERAISNINSLGIKQFEKLFASLNPFHQLSDGDIRLLLLEGENNDKFDAICDAFLENGKYGQGLPNVKKIDRLRVQDGQGLANVKEIDRLRVQAYIWVYDNSEIGLRFHPILKRSEIDKAILNINSWTEDQLNKFLMIVDSFPIEDIKSLLLNGKDKYEFETIYRSFDDLDSGIISLTIKNCNNREELKKCAHKWIYDNSEGGGYHDFVLKRSEIEKALSNVDSWDTEQLYKFLITVDFLRQHSFCDLRTLLLAGKNKHEFEAIYESFKEKGKIFNFDNEMNYLLEATERSDVFKKVFFDYEEDKEADDYIADLFEGAESNDQLLKTDSMKKHRIFKNLEDYIDNFSNELKNNPSVGTIRLSNDKPWGMKTSSQGGDLRICNYNNSSQFSNSQNTVKISNEDDINRFKIRNEDDVNRFKIRKNEDDNRFKIHIDQSFSEPNNVFYIDAADLNTYFITFITSPDNKPGFCNEGSGVKKYKCQDNTLEDTINNDILGLLKENNYLSEREVPAALNNLKNMELDAKYELFKNMVHHKDDPKKMENAKFTVLGFGQIFNDNF